MRVADEYRQMSTKSNSTDVADE
eukprot:COSAG05_NODE_3684_length_1908_cov_2.498065_1_plen_22_part_10